MFIQPLSQRLLLSRLLLVAQGRYDAVQVPTGRLFRLGWPSADNRGDDREVLSQ